jgi:hypothetical protein
VWGNQNALYTLIANCSARWSSVAFLLFAHVIEGSTTRLNRSLETPKLSLLSVMGTQLAIQFVFIQQCNSLRVLQDSAFEKSKIQDSAVLNLRHSERYYSVYTSQIPTFDENLVISSSQHRSANIVLPKSAQMWLSCLTASASGRNANNVGLIWSQSTSVALNCTRAFVWPSSLDEGKQSTVKPGRGIKISFHLITFLVFRSLLKSASTGSQFRHRRI